MPSSMKRQHVRAGRIFYTTVLILTLFSIYSFLRSIDSDSPKEQRHGRTALIARGLHTRELECRTVHKYSDQCSFVQQNCPDEEAGLFSYLQLYYCRLASAKPVAFIILVLWIGLLFSTIGIAASDFLCINLSTIATLLGMSESLTGVTFLAFGNGSPDVFSTFAAMKSNSGSLAVGELMGAAGFITAVVAGSMALVKPFNVARRSFVRDVAFFTVAASFSLVFLIDGNLRLWECAAMVGFYGFYVVFVEATARLHHHIEGTQELEAPNLGEEDEESAPMHERRISNAESLPLLHTPDTPIWQLEEIDEDGEARDRYLAELQSNMRVTKPNRRDRRNTITPIRPSLIGALEFRSVLSSLERKSTQASNISLRRYSDDPAAFLDQADNHHASSQPALISTAFDSNEHLHEGGASRRGRAVSANDVDSLRIDTQFLSVPGTVPEDAVYSAEPTPIFSPGADRQRYDEVGGRGLEPSILAPSPQLLLSPAEDPGVRSANDERHAPKDLLAPPNSYFHDPRFSRSATHEQRSPVMSPKHGSHLNLPRADHIRSPLMQSFPAYTDSPPVASPGVMTPSSTRPPSIHLPAPSLSPESTAPRLYDEEEDEEYRPLRWWPYAYVPAPRIIVSTLFPTIYGWREKSIVDKLLGLATAPSVFLLTVTLPVVESQAGKEELDPDPGLLDSHIGNRSRSNTRVSLPPDSPYIPGKQQTADAPPHPHRQLPSRHDSYKSPEPNTQEASGPKEWNRWLVIVQLFTAPLFTVLIVWANIDEDHSMRNLTLAVLGSLIFSLVLLFILLATTTPDHEPKYRPLFCFLGFAVAIAWISTIANEVVGVLKAFGVILGISDAILGLTIFAVGNSLGDFVADVTVARLGYPVMALSACFGGPMLNILLGIGIGGLYMTIHNGTHRHAKHPDKPIRYKPYEVEVGTSLIISGVTLLVTLVGLLIAVPLDGWRMSRRIGIGLIALWSVSTLGNVIVEVLGYGGDVSMFQ